MIIYSVTCSVDSSIELEWIEWMKNEHLPEVMETGLFTAHTFSEVLGNASGNDHKSFNIQYEIENMEIMHKYNTEFAPILKQKTLNKFGDKCIAFRTLLRKMQ